MNDAPEVTLRRAAMFIQGRANEASCDTCRTRRWQHRDDAVYEIADEAHRVLLTSPLAPHRRSRAKHASAFDPLAAIGLAVLLSTIADAFDRCDHDIQAMALGFAMTYLREEVDQ